MAARPRKEYVSWVKAEGPSWVGFWYVYDEGRRLQKRRKVCDKKGVTLTEARERHAQWLREHVETIVVPKAAPVQLRDLWERQISQFTTKVVKGKRSTGWESTQRSLWKLLEPLDGVAADIEPEEVEELFERLEEGEYAASTRRKARSLLAKLLRGHSTAVERAEVIITSDPKLPPLGLEQVRLLRMQLSGLDLLRLDVYVGLGLSAHEGVRLRLLDVNGDRIWIPGTKNAFRAAELPLPADLADRLGDLVRRHREAGRPDTHRLLFDTANHRPWLENVLQPAAERAGIGKVDMLVLRRTAGTMASRHTSIGAVSRMLRHATTATTQKHYVGGDDAEVREVMEMIFADFQQTVQ